MDQHYGRRHNDGLGPFWRFAVGNTGNAACSNWIAETVQIRPSQMLTVICSRQSGVHTCIYFRHRLVYDVHVHTQMIIMTTTKIFKNGNSQAVRIPAELAYERTDLELEIERIGDELRIRPTPRRLDHLLEKFSRFSADLKAEGRGENREGERDAL